LYVTSVTTVLRVRLRVVCGKGKREENRFGHSQPYPHKRDSFRKNYKIK
jgi:hypothetical protein